jgi:hypothetical protein
MAQGGGAFRRTWNKEMIVQGVIVAGVAIAVLFTIGYLIAHITLP